MVAPAERAEYCAKSEGRDSPRLRKTRRRISDRDRRNCYRTVYFRLLRNGLKLPAVSVVVHPGADSHPRHVIATAVDILKDHGRRARKGLLGMNEPAKFDQVWAVIDTDVLVRHGVWNEIEQLATARNVRLAHSTPCFEYWLLLHITEFTTRPIVDGTAAKATVKATFGRDYSTNEDTAKTVMPEFLQGWPKAVKSAERVREYHFDAGNRVPANPSTEVDRLVCAMNDSAPEHARLIPCSHE